MPAFRPALLRLIPLALLLVSCGGDSTGVSNRGVLLTIENGDQQIGTVGTSLPAPVQVQVTDLLDHPVSGQVVNFIILAGGGDVDHTVYTDGSGIASATWELGTVAGSAQQVEARTLGSDGIRKTVTFIATAAADQPDTITAASPVQLSAAAGTVVRTSPSVRLADRFGNLVPNYLVTFAVTSGGGSLQGAAGTSDSSGIATVQSWTLGSSQGANQLTATTAGLVPIVFNATGTSPTASHVSFAVEPASIAQSGVVLTRQPVAQLLNDSDDPIPTAGVMVTASILSGTGVLIGAAQIATDGNGEVTYTNLAIGGTVGTFTLGLAAPALAPDTSALIGLAPGPATTIVADDGLNQDANAGSTLTVHPSVTISDDWGNGIPGVGVTFAVATGGGSVTGGSQTTDANGDATVGSWTLGPTAGNNSLVATAAIGGLVGNPQTFDALGLGDFWSARTSMPTPRRFSAVGVINGRMYVAGGKDASFTTVRTLEIYNPATNIWTFGAPMNTPRVGAQFGVINGILYAAGGADANDVILNTVEAYDPVSNGWINRANMPEARGFGASAVVNGILYIASGGNSAGQMKSVAAYNPASNTWSTLDSLPAARNDAVGVALNNLFYVIGGQQGNTNDGALQVYDPVTNSWSNAATMINPRYHVNAEVVNGKIYVAGGLATAGATSMITDVYDPNTNTWTQVADLPTGRSGAATGAIGGLLYLAGGSVASGGILGVHEAYVPE